MPLYRDSANSSPNITQGLLGELEQFFGRSVSETDFAAYIYALLGGQSYTLRFWNQLETLCPRVPITKDSELFARVVKLGRKLIWLHTFAERFAEDDDNRIPQGTATTIKGVPSEENGYPVKFSYDETKSEISVGDGRFGPVSPKVWEFEVSGMKVVQSWLGYRMKTRRGRKSSELDDIRPKSWTPAMSDEFLELLWVLEATLDMEPNLEKLLDEVVAGSCFKGSELPMPSPEQKNGLKSVAGPGSLL